MGDGEKAPLRLQFNPKVRLEFQGSTITSDAGLLPLRKLDEALGLTSTASGYLQDHHTGRNIQHHLVPLLRQSIYSRLAGYDDTNDADRLAQDSAMRVVVGWQGAERNAASANTMSRFETVLLTQEHNLKGLASMNAQWVQSAMDHTPHRRVILDLDSSDGSVVGLLVGLTGAGGAALAIPGMTLLLGVPAMTAVATAFPFTSFTKVFAFLEHRRLGTIHWPVAKYYFIGTIPGTLVGVVTLSHLYERLGSALDFWLKLVIGLLLILSVLFSLFQRWAAVGLAPDLPSALTLSQKFLAVGVSAVLGVIIGATSVGGGSFLLISILVFFPIRTVKAAGTSIAVSLFLMIEGAIVYFGTGLMDIPLALAMAGGAVPAAILGSRMAKRVPESLLGITVSGAVLVAGGLLILRLFPWVP